jgi:flagellar hook protein FlgE
MGINSALYTGVSGLNTNGNAMSVLGNNIANTNTVGFKSSRTVFSDLLSASISGSGGSSQVGRGVQLSIVDNIFSQGTFENTESNTDLAIEGEGFFIVKPDDSEETFFTRAGAFRFNENGYLVNPEGLRVQGKAFQDDGTLSAGDPTDIQVDIGTLIQAQQTANVNMTTNLDSNAVGIAGGFDVTDPVGTSNYANSTRVYDSLGNTHLVTTYFTKSDSNPNEWDWNTVVDGGELVGGTPGALELVGNGTLQFDVNGDLVAGATGATNPGALEWDNGADIQNIDLSFKMTQYSSDSIVISQSQDGYGAGSLVKIAIDGDGVVTANYSNGERMKVSQIALAKFPNPGGLAKAGSNLYEATDASGDIRTGVPGSELGKIFTNALEQSNVDLAQEFVKMITTQRGFQANSKIITTTDELLAELINLKR